MYFASGCVGKITGLVSVPRSNGERSNKTLTAEEGEAKISLLSSKSTQILTWCHFRLISLEIQKARERVSPKGHSALKS